MLSPLTLAQTQKHLRTAISELSNTIESFNTVRSTVLKLAIQQPLLTSATT